jgi:hypothetical protein
MSVPDMHGDGARPPSRGTRRFLKSKRTAGVLAGAVVLAIGIALPAMAVLSGSPSKFESNDGNMIVDTPGNNDWASVTTNPNYVHITDPASTSSDDSFQPGQKQDTVCPVIVQSKNPPKTDFTDVASFNETNFTSGDTFLYGATIRVAANGTASENVELNQGKNGNCGTDPVTGTTLLARTVGDKLIAIDYTTGGTVVTFSVLTWIDGTNLSNPTCFVKTDTPPCWGGNVQTLSSNAAEGLANQSPITAANNSISGTALVVNQFAEFGVNLTAAGIVPPNACSAFPQTVWESRTSGSSFVSSTTDIALEHHLISNCGTLVVKKVTDPSPDPTNTSFGFSLNGSNPPNTSLPKSFSLLNGGSDSTQVFAGSNFSVAETVPTNWVLTSATCDNKSGTLSGSTLSGISVAANSTTTCTFNDKLNLGAIKIIKTSSKAAATPLAGAVFSIKDSGGTPITGSPVTTGADGTACVDHLPFGNYSVQETAAPPGYSIDNSTPQTVTVNANSTCGDGHEATFKATDTPLTDVSVTSTSEAPGGTKSTITCVDSSTPPNNIGNSPQGPVDPANVTAKGLKPGTYTCTIVIDP